MGSYLIERATNRTYLPHHRRDYVWHTYAGDHQVAIERVLIPCGCTSVEAYDIGRYGDYTIRHAFVNLCDGHARANSRKTRETLRR